jgi:hypothetical protein
MKLIAEYVERAERFEMPHSDVVRAGSALTVSWHDLQWWVVLIIAGGCALSLAWLWLTGLSK